MKKALNQSRAPQPVARRAFPLRTRIAGALALVALTAGLGTFASRPAHTAGGPIAVNVANAPLATANVDNPEQQPFQYVLGAGSDTSSFASASYTVPAGKRVVIEYYSAQLTQFPVGGEGHLYLYTMANGHYAYYAVVPPVGSTVPFNQLTRIYADPGTTITASVEQSSGSSCGGGVILSGHFVDVK